ncbi:protein kinase [Candidatus Uhrbacteria bacterium]|nr:protein kinase [Candidatus Uhrbacteria bacterium]
MSASNAVAFRMWPAPHLQRVSGLHPDALKPGTAIVRPWGEPLLIWAPLGQGGTAAVNVCVPLATAASDGTLDESYLMALPRDPGVYQILTASEVAELRRQPGIRPLLQVVKLLNPPPGASAELAAHCRERLRQEGRLLAGMVGDPSFPVYLGRADEPLPHLVLSFIAGLSLYDIVGNPGLVSELGFTPAGWRLPWRFIYFAASKIARAVTRLHLRAQVVHRDLKPENMVVVPLTASGEAFFEVVILDLGVAKELVRDAEDLPDLTAVFGAAGATPRYCAPEQLIGSAVSEATDTFALGRMLCEMSQGSQALPDSVNAGELLEVARRPLPDCTHPDLHPAVRVWMQDLWREMTSFDPVRRPALAEVLRRLKHCEAMRMRGGR